MNVGAVRDALLADARREADAARAAAEAEAVTTVAAARADRDRLLAAARRDGEAEARMAAAIELARARRQARELVLAARRAAYEQLRAAARAEVSGLRHGSDYDDVVEGLARLARRQLGDDARVTVDEEVGGLVARAGSRTVDYRLPAVADRCLAALGPDLEELWR